MYTTLESLIFFKVEKDSPRRHDIADFAIGRILWIENIRGLGRNTRPSLFFVFCFVLFCFFFFFFFRKVKRFWKEGREFSKRYKLSY